MKPLTPTELQRAAELLDSIIRPDPCTVEGDHEMSRAIEQARILLGYAVPVPIKVRARPGRPRKNPTYWEKQKP